RRAPRGPPPRLPHPWGAVRAPASAAGARPRERRPAADPGSACAPAPSVPAAEDAAARAGLAGPGGDPARGRRLRATRMSRLGTTAMTFLLLGAADAVVTYRLVARHGRHVTRWASDTAWSEAMGDETWHLWPA